MQTIFYYRANNNEIYEIKFISLIINLTGHAYYINRGQYAPQKIEIEVAGLGRKEWNRYIGGCDFNYRKIYRSIENAMNDVAPIFGSHGEYNNMKDFDLNFENIPSFIVKTNQNVLGSAKVNYGTYVWNGLEAKFTTSIGDGDILCNSYKDLMYDLITRECFYDKSIKGYATKEECVNNNFVKVHRF